MMKRRTRDRSCSLAFCFCEFLVSGRGNLFDFFGREFSSGNKEMTG